MLGVHLDPMLAVLGRPDVLPLVAPGPSSALLALVAWTLDARRAAREEPLTWATGRWPRSRRAGMRPAVWLPALRFFLLGVACGFSLCWWFADPAGGARGFWLAGAALAWLTVTTVTVASGILRRRDRPIVGPSSSRGVQGRPEMPAMGMRWGCDGDATGHATAARISREDGGES